MRKRLFFATIVLALLGCSAGAKKESYHQSGPVVQERGEGQYQKSQIVFEKYGKKYDPSDTARLDNTTILESEPVREYTPPKVRKSSNVIVITKEGDVYQKEIKGE